MDVQLEVVRALNRADLTARTYVDRTAAYEQVFAQYGPTALVAGVGEWLERMLAMRRFSVADEFDRPTAEREAEFALLQRLGWPCVSAEVDALFSRCIYLLGEGDRVGARESLEALKALAATNVPKLPADVDVMIGELERRCSREAS